ncbi:MAG: hypothetical protein ACLP19_07365 [Xanthobacteraceae bacterium]
MRAHIAVDNFLNYVWRNKREGRQQADMPLDFTFALGDFSE